MSSRGPRDESVRPWMKFATYPHYVNLDAPDELQQEAY